MKKRNFSISIILCLALFTSAQVPQKFNYQAVVRDAQHGVIANQDVGFRMSILEGSANGSPVYVETHTVTANGLGLTDLVIGDGAVASGIFEEIVWGGTAMFLKVEMDPAGGTSYQHVGTSQLISVPYALYSGNISSPTRKFTIQEEMGHPVDSALFEVRNAEGQTVFAVYPEGTRVYVLDEASKGVKRGFAVGGYSRNSKGVTQEYMHVSPDSIRMYFDKEATKGVKGGFAVGGYSRDRKGVSDHYFELKPDSAKFLMVSDQPADSYSGALSVISKSTLEGDPSGGANLFNLTRENYSIGHRAGASITSGTQNSFFGFESGANTTEGFGNIFIGERSGYENTYGRYNSFIGHLAGHSNIDGFNNVFLGFAAGRENVTSVNNIYIGTSAGEKNMWGDANVFIGVEAGYEADSSKANVFIGGQSGYRNSGGEANVFIGNYTGKENLKGTGNTFIGVHSGSFNVDGSFNTFFGSYAGWKSVDASNNVYMGHNAGRFHVEGDNNVIVGERAGWGNQTGESNVFIGGKAGELNYNGRDNIFIGYQAGLNEPGDGKLYINVGAHASDNALIYGEFYNNRVQINSQLGIGMVATDNALEVAGNVSKTAPGDWLANSDARIKHEVLDIKDASEQILKLRPVTFRYTEEWILMNPSLKDKVYYNFIAQEYREVFPQSVQMGGGSLEGETEPLLQLDTHPAQIVAIKAIQELVEQNRSQQILIEELIQKVSALEKEVSGIIN